jgi:hypothetical protein
MRFFTRTLWLGICLAVFAACAVAVARVQWEQGYRQVTLAIHLGDLYRRSQAAGNSLHREGVGWQAVTVSPQDIRELHPHFFPSYPEGAAIPLADLEHLAEGRFALFWRLDTPVSADQFDSLLSALFSVQLQGLLLVYPFSLSPQHLNTLLDYLQIQPVLVGLPEFQSAVGADQLYRQGYRRFIRVHALPLADQAMLDEAGTIDRYMRAVVERNVRFLEIGAAHPEALTQELSRAGFTTGLPSPSAPFAPNRWTLLLLWLGLVSLIMVCVERLTGFAYPGNVLLWLWMALLGGLAFLESEGLALRAAAWLTAVFVPVAAFILLCERPRWLQASGLPFLLAFSVISTLGGLAAAAFVSTDAYFLQIQAFPGVKASLIWPIVCIGVLSLRNVEWASFRTRDALLWGAGGLLLAVVLLRSGNLSIWPASEVEIGVRSWLEEVLIVRPRFKEFLIGHPLLVLWGGLGAQRWHPWALAILCVGLLGQVSIINSYEHLHTPLGVTLLRTSHGLWLGAALGGLLHVFLRRVLRFSLPGS